MNQFDEKNPIWPQLIKRSIKAYPKTNNTNRKRYEITVTENQTYLHCPILGDAF